MNKSELVEVLAKKAELSQRQADQFVNLLVDCMIAAMMREERIEIRGFGSFVVRRYKGYEGRNPKSGEKIRIPDKRLPFFKAGKDLVERANHR